MPLALIASEARLAPPRAGRHTRRVAAAARVADLLLAEIGIIYGLLSSPETSLPSPSGRDVLAVVGWSEEARVVAVGDQARRMLGTDDEIQGLLASGAYAPGTVPRLLAALRGRAAERGPAGLAAVTGGPCFIFPGGLATVVPCPLPVIVSDSAGRDRARELLRPGSWEPEEWAELIRGDIGSWAFALDGDAVVSICHTPVSDDHFSEAGVWTDQNYRGRGLAPSVAKAWWAWERQFKDALFYSTSADNAASRAVARKLGLRPLGWLWTARIAAT